MYILDDDHNLVPVADYHAFYEWLDAKRAAVGQELPLATLQVRYDQVAGHTLSTVFLGADHNWGEPPPLVFETMYFDGDDRMWRWSTWDEAVAGHERLMDELADDEYEEPELPALWDSTFGHV